MPFDDTIQLTSADDWTLIDDDGRAGEKITSQTQRKGENDPKVIIPRGLPPKKT